MVKPRQLERKNTRYFTPITPDKDIADLRIGYRESSQVIRELHGTGKVYPWSQNTQQLSRPRFKSKD